MVTTTLFTAQSIRDRLFTLESLVAQGQSALVNVSRGDIGKLIYYFYGGHLLEREDWLHQGYQLLDKVFKTVSHQHDPRIMNATLASGLAGLGFALEILHKEGFLNEPLDNYLRQLDHYVYQGSMQRIQRGDTDFLHGSMGGFHYLLYRLPKNAAIREYLQEFVKALDHQAIPYGQDALYFPNEFMQFEAAPNEVNLGLAHGMSATLLVLVQLLEKEIAPALTARLLEQAINFILQFQQQSSYHKAGESYFPNSILLGKSKRSDRNPNKYNGGLRWCYGDMNITHVLYKAAQVLQRSDWYVLANQVGLSTLSLQDITLAKCHGSLFCHGAAGIAYYYQRLHAISGQAAYLQGYAYWMEQAWQLQAQEMEDPYWRDMADYFLEGFVGSSIIFMTHLHPHAHAWHDLWLLH